MKFHLSCLPASLRLLAAAILRGKVKKHFAQDWLFKSGQNNAQLICFRFFNSLGIPWERFSSQLEVWIAWPVPGSFALNCRWPKSQNSKNTYESLDRKNPEISRIHRLRLRKLTFTRLELKDTASYTGERSEEDPEEVTIRITFVHLAIIGL